MVTQLAPVWELLKLVHWSESLSKDCLIFVYLVAVLLHYALSQIYPNLFDKLKKFNFGFTVQYIILSVLNIQVNSIIPCIILGIVATYLTSFSKDFMAIASSNLIFSYLLFQGLLIFVLILSPSNDESAILLGCLFTIATTVFIYAVAVILQLRKLISYVYYGYDYFMKCGDVEEGRAITSQANNTSNVNYSTFTN